jgi:maltooligosyltrehalose trehalohydrolase
MRILGPHWINRNTLGIQVWGPKVKTMALALEDQTIPMSQDQEGYWYTEVTGAKPGDLYALLLDGEKRRPDPVSFHLPEGVHGRSEVPPFETFGWSDSHWHGLAMKDAIFYEMHVGTFTPEGTLDAAITKLDHLQDLGITAIELLPLSQFSGERNWGYDGVGPWSVQSSYGGPEALKRFVDEAHSRGIAVGLDVVYNHLGPEGNYLWDYGPYFTQKYQTPWGEALNFDGEGSEGVREYFLGSALRWVGEFHIDFLRLDAIHNVYDLGARPILREIAQQTKALARSLGRQFFLVAESDLNDVRVLESPELGGLAIDGQWADEIHHALHTTLTGEDGGYYADFGRGTLEKALEKFFVYDGNYRPTHGRKYGRNTLGWEAWRFVSNLQNHDQIGNRAWGERIGTLLQPAQQRLALAFVILHPGAPLLYMGQEYNETNPFQFFVSHQDHGLLQAVSQGRHKEFAAFGWDETPDPAEPSTFTNSKLNWERLNAPEHHDFFQYTKRLIDLRKHLSFLQALRVGDWKVSTYSQERLFLLEIPEEKGGMVLAGNFSDQAQKLPELSILQKIKPRFGSGQDGWGKKGAASQELGPFELVVYY